VSTTHNATASCVVDTRGWAVEFSHAVNAVMWLCGLAVCF